MPTYSQNLPLIPTEYVPIDYSHDAQFQLAEAQAAATNIAKVKSRYEDLLGMDLTSDKSKEALSSFMKGAEEDLRKVSGMDMMVASNATDALNILKPLTDLDGQYGYIVVDNVFTKKYKNNKGLASQARVKGENYNQDADEYLDIQRKRFENTDDVNQWKYILSDTIDYTPYYDGQKELMDLVSKFKPDSIEAEQAGGGRIITTKDQSVYAAKLQDYLDANLSDKYKNQMNLRAKVNYGKQQLLAYDPNTKSYDGSKIYKYYDDLLTDLKTTKINVYNQEKNSLEREVTLLSNNAEGMEKQKELKKRIGQLKNGIESISGQTLDKALFDNPADYRKAEAVASNIVAMKDLTDKAISLAHLDISITQKADEVYWEQKKLSLEQDKFTYQRQKDESDREWDKQKTLIQAGIKHFDKNGNIVDGPAEDYYEPTYKTDKNQEKLTSGADRGKNKLNKVSDKLNSLLNSGTLDFIDAQFGVGFKAAIAGYDKERSKFAGKTWGEVTSGTFKSLGQSPAFNQFLLASAEKTRQSTNLIGQKLFGSKVLSATTGSAVSRITTEKGVYLLNKNDNKIYDLNGKFLGVHNVKFTQEDLNNLSFDEVKNLAITSINSPLARQALKRSLSARDYTKADIQLQLAEENKKQLESKVKDSFKGTLLESADIDLTKINNQDYMNGKIDQVINQIAPSFIGTSDNGKIVRDVSKNQNGEWIVNFGNGDVREIYETGLLDKYTNSKSGFNWWGGFGSTKNRVIKGIADKIYENFDNNTSDLVGDEKEQYAAVPELVPRKDRAGDKDLKDQWSAYRANNLNIVRNSNNGQKAIVGLVNDFPEAFISVKDANGYRFELNGAYVESVMTETEKKQLFDRLDNVIGNWTSAFGSTFGDNIGDAEEAVEDLNSYVEKNDPDFFKVVVDNYDNSSFANEQNSATILTGGGFTFKQNIPEEYANINLNPLSLSVTNYGAATLADADLKFTGDILIPKIDKQGLIQWDDNGKAQVSLIKASDFNFTPAQLLAKPMEIVENAAVIANAHASILTLLNNPPKGVKFKYIKDVVDYAIEQMDMNLISDLKAANIIK